MRHLTLLSLLLIASCRDDTVLAPSPAGQALVSDDGSVEVILPDGFDVGQVTIKMLGVTQVPGTEALLVAVDLGPDGLEFPDEPARILIHYDESLIPPGFTEDHILFVAEVNGEWVLVQAELDREANTITAELSHFSVYGAVIPSMRDLRLPIDAMADDTGGGPVAPGLVAMVGNRMGPNGSIQGVLRVESMLPDREPELLAVVEGQEGESFRSVALYEGLAYVTVLQTIPPVTGLRPELRIFDLSVPEFPRLAGSVKLDPWLPPIILRRPALPVVVARGGDGVLRCFMAAGGQGQVTQLVGIDVSDPFAPQIASTAPAASGIPPMYDLALRGDLLYALSGDGLRIFGPTSPVSPTIDQATPDVLAVGGIAMSIDGNELAIADYDGETLHLVDITDPGAPKVIRSFGQIPHPFDVSISGGAVVVASSSVGPASVDLTSGAVIPFGAVGSAANALYPGGPGGGIVIGSIFDHLGSTPARWDPWDIFGLFRPVPGLVTTGVYYSDEPCHDVALMFDLATPVRLLAFAAATSSLLAFDTTDRMGGEAIGALDLHALGFGDVVAVAVVQWPGFVGQPWNARAFVATRGPGFPLIPQSPGGPPSDPGGEFPGDPGGDFPGEPSGDALVVVDISDPANPQALGWVPTPGRCDRIEVRVVRESANAEMRVFVARMDAMTPTGLYEIDVADDAPTVVRALPGGCGVDGEATLLGGRGLVYVAGPTHTLSVPTYPAFPETLGAIFDFDFLVEGALLRGNALAMRGLGLNPDGTITRRIYLNGTNGSGDYLATLLVTGSPNEPEVALVDVQTLCSLPPFEQGRGMSVFAGRDLLVCHRDRLLHYDVATNPDKPALQDVLDIPGANGVMLLQLPGGHDHAYVAGLHGITVAGLRRP